MPVIINEIVIRSTVGTGADSSVQKSGEGAAPSNSAIGPASAESLVRQAVERVLEIMEEKMQR